MEHEIQQFLTYMAAERGASANTISAYRNDLAQLSAYIAEHQATPEGGDNGVARSIGLINAEDLQDYVAHLREQQYAAATIARKVAAVKSLFGYLHGEGLINANPAEQLSSPRVGRNLPRTLSIQEVDALLEQPGRWNTPEAARDQAMLELLYATGMRVSEFVSLNLSSIELQGQSASVRCIGKGRRERMIPIHSAAVAALHHYLQEARPKLAHGRREVALFINRRGERLTRQGVWLIIKNYAKAAGITGVTPHTLRHSFATHLLRGSAPLRNVQELMGHANISTTQLYTQLTDEHLRDVYDRAHPRAS